MAAEIIAECPRSVDYGSAAPRQRGPVARPFLPKEGQRCKGSVMESIVLSTDEKDSDCETALHERANRPPDRSRQRPRTLWPRPHHAAPNPDPISRTRPDGHTPNRYAVPASIDRWQKPPICPAHREPSRRRTERRRTCRGPNRCSIAMHGLSVPTAALDGVRSVR